MAQAAARGNLSLTIDEAELEASLAFSPSPEGAEWSADKILRLAMDARVGSLNQRKAEELVAKFARARGPVVEVIAAGQPPEEPVPEEPEWEALPLPPGLEDLAAEILASAPPPAPVRVVVENVKREKTVTKPAALPFLPPKVEKVVVTERRERREVVAVDPTVVRTGFAEKDARIAILSTAKPGKPGRSIFGKPIQPRGEEVEFVLGEGLVKAKNAVVATREGLVRAGDHWVELIPLNRARWTVDRSPDGASFFLNFQPGHPRLPRPAASEILAAAAKAGAPGDSLLAEGDLEAILDESTASGEPLFSRSLSLDRDASIDIAVSPDGLRATLSLRKGRGRGRPLDLAALGPALKAAGIKGLKAEQLKKDVLEFFKSDRPELLDLLLAEGRAPTRGKGRSLSFTVAFHPDERRDALLARLAAHPGLAAALPSVAEFPLGPATRLAPVIAGQRFGEFGQGTPGQDGVDVRGAVLPGLPGNDPPIRFLENAELSKGGAVARVSGLLAVEDKAGIAVLRVLPFKDRVVEAGVSADGMEAWLNLVAESGLGEPLTVEEAVAALQAKGVALGLDPKAVADAVAAARSGAPVVRRVVATGRPAVPAGGTRVERIARPVAGATRVAAGDPLIRVFRAGASGGEGATVLGKPVLPTRAAGAVLPPTHDGSIREVPGEGDSVTWIAAASGELVESGNAWSVRGSLGMTGDIGPLSGNVRFSGGVATSGSVRSGFQLVAGGDVAVAGDVEAALVSSDGSVRVGGGVKGGRRGTIRAKGGIEASFAEQAKLLAVGDVSLRGACLLCEVKTNGRLVLQGPKGSLTGGICRARKGIEVESLGSANAVKTEVSFGQDYLVADMIAAEERELEKVKALVLQADRSMAELERAFPGGAPGGAAGGGAGLDRVRQDKVKLLKLLEKRSLRLFDFREKFEEHFPSEVRVRGTVFPGVILESHNRFFEVRSRKSGVIFAFDPRTGRIAERPL